MTAIQALIASRRVSARETPNAEQNTCRREGLTLCTPLEEAGTLDLS